MKSILAGFLFLSLSGVASALEVKLGPETGPFQTKEPKSSGGGTTAVCKEDATFVSKIQLGRDPDGQRWINVWCRKLVVQ